MGMVHFANSVATRKRGQSHAFWMLVLILSNIFQRINFEQEFVETYKK